MSKPKAALIGGVIGAVITGGLFALCVSLTDFSGGIPIHGGSFKGGLLVVGVPALSAMGFIGGAFVGYTRGKP